MLCLTYWLIWAACFIAGVGLLAKIRLRQLRSQEACREAFYGFAEKLTIDPETPGQVIDIIKMLLGWITSRTFLWNFVIALMMGRVRRRRWDSLEIYNQIPIHLRADYIGLLVSFVFSLTNNNIFVGAIVRRFLFV